MLELEVPEYFVTTIGRVERLGGNCVRLTMCVQKGNVLEPRYTCIWPIECLMTRAQLVTVINQAGIGEVITH